MPPSGIVLAAMRTLTLALRPRFDALEARVERLERPPA
jgi:hypothetical protein